MTPVMSGSVKRNRFGAHRELLNVRFAPKATELLRRRLAIKQAPQHVDLIDHRWHGVPCLRDNILLQYSGQSKASAMGQDRQNAK
jgi:hypothetical protein